MMQVINLITLIQYLPVDLLQDAIFVELINYIYKLRAYLQAILGNLTINGSI